MIDLEGRRIKFLEDQPQAISEDFLLGRNGSILNEERHGAHLEHGSNGPGKRAVEVLKCDPSHVDQERARDDYHHASYA